jgi:D-beta-D-heptose 7-phosphate kinase/D-beta-D-heptose 1-phosphate adenosyltransferase
MKKIVLVTGGFDPLHSGHIAYFEAAAKLGDILIVGVNSDDWLGRKKGRAFMPFTERSAIIRNLRCVDFVIGFNDDDNTAKDAIRMVRQSYPQDICIFANGGDRTRGNIPEMDIDEDKVQFVFGVGGTDKANSSSWILDEWKAPKTERPWGYYRILHSPNRNVKVKELVVNPGQSLSMQRHFKRAEEWFVAEGIATVWTRIGDGTGHVFRGMYNRMESLNIPLGSWHKLENQAAGPLKIVEIQYGDECLEADIERA